MESTETTSTDRATRRRGAPEPRLPPARRRGRRERRAPGDRRPPRQGGRAAARGERAAPTATRWRRRSTATRKDLKKARAALRLVRDELGEKTFKRENRALRDAARTLSASRDAEVKLATLDALAEGDGDVPPAATALWREALVADRDRIVGGESGGTEEAVAAIEAVAARAPEWKLRADGWKLLSPGLDTAYREGRERSPRSATHPTSRPSTTCANAARTSGTSCACCGTPGSRCWSRPPKRSTTSPTCSATTTTSPSSASTWSGARRSTAIHRETLRTLIEARQASLLAEAPRRRRADLRREAEGFRPPHPRLLARLAARGLSGARGAADLSL